MWLHPVYKQDLRDAASSTGTTNRLLVVDKCTEDDYYKRCDGTTEYQYPQLLQVNY